MMQSYAQEILEIIDKRKEKRMISEMSITTLGGADSERISFEKDGDVTELKCHRHGGCSFYRIKTEDLLRLVATLYKDEVLGR